MLNLVNEKLTGVFRGLNQKVDIVISQTNESLTAIQRRLLATNTTLYSETDPQVQITRRVLRDMTRGPKLDSVAVVREDGTYLVPGPKVIELGLDIDWAWYAEQYFIFASFNTFVHSVIAFGEKLEAKEAEAKEAEAVKAEDERKAAAKAAAEELATSQEVTDAMVAASADDPQYPPHAAIFGGE